jgi:hypothetical protein
MDPEFNSPTAQDRDGTMGQLADALGIAAHQLSARLQDHWSDMTKGSARVLLPQSWRFETQSESAVLRIDRKRRVSVGADVIEHPDVIVKWDHSALVGALQAGRSNEKTREPPPSIRFTSDSGRKAFSLLGTSLGL